MQKQFEITMERIEGQIKDFWSAPHAEERLKILLAVSGGADSMCMADLFVRSCYPCEIVIAHCNFNLRSKESDGDQKMVEDWAREHGLQLLTASFETERHASENGVSIEMAARELRYRWFAQISAAYGCHAVAVAHNANDNAETLMLNLLRGTGVKGLCAMSEISALPVPDSGNVVLIRPLLHFTRKQIEGHVHAFKVPSRNDSTNYMSEYKRNRLRNEAFPVFERINPSFIQTFNHEIRLFSDVSSIIDDYCRSSVSGICSGDMPLEIDVAALISRKHWRYLLYYILEPYGFNSSVLSSIEDLVLSDRTQSGKCFESPSYILYTGRDRFIVSRRNVFTNDNPQAISLAEPVMVVRGIGRYLYNGRTFEVSVHSIDEGVSFKRNDGVLSFDAQKLSFPFVMRRWNQGDWFIPLGMKGKKKVSDFFTDLKYDILKKKDAVVIRKPEVKENGSQISHVAAVLGERIDDRFKITPATSSVVVIREI